MEQQRADHRVVSDGKILGLKNGTATITACSVADSTKCTKISVTVTGAPADTKNTTTFYLNADGYTASNKAKLYYTFDGSTWTSAAMESTENCSGWVSVTIDNAGLKAATYLFYKGDSLVVLPVGTTVAAQMARRTLVFRRSNRQYAYRTMRLSMEPLPVAARAEEALLPVRSPLAEARMRSDLTRPLR